MASIANSSNSRSSSNSMASIANGSNSRSGSNSGNWSSMSNTKWDMRNSVGWGSMGSYNSLARVSLICGVVDVRSLNDFLDGVDLVGSWDMDGTGNRNFIRLSNMGDLNDLTGNSTWDSNRDINVVVLDIDFWNNVGDLRGDSGMSSDR